MNLNEKLEKLTTKDPSTWLEKAEWRRQNRGWLRKSANIALKVLGELRHRGMTQRELAEKMGMSAQQVNKIVKGQENLTLETIDKLERALNIQLLHDGRTEAAIVLNFESLPVIQKTGMLMHKLFFEKEVMNNIVRCIDAHFLIAGSTYFRGQSSAKLHTRYPIEGKETWLQIHSEHS